MSVNEPGAVVDVSNVCWSKKIEPMGKRGPHLGRLDLLRDAWHRSRGERASLTLIADNSLRWQIPRAELPALDAMVRDREIRLVPFADPELLALARDGGLYVISGDHFIDLRRAHPWIPSAAPRFLTWSQGPVGLRLVRSGIREVSEQCKSRAEEDKELVRGSGIDPRRKDHARILEQDWHCVSASCHQAMLWPDRLLLWPEIVRGDGSARCPSCGSRLESKGPRPLFRVVVVSEASTDEEILRFPLPAETPVRIGRGRLPYGVDLGAPDLPHPAATRRISRNHLQLTLSGVHASVPGGHLVVKDIGSSNGTVLERFGAGPAAGAMAPGEETRLGPGDALLLAGSVRVRLSGHLYFPGDRGLPLSGGDVAATTGLV